MQAAGLVGALATRLGAQLIETHISWVLLADNRAYKIKKPVHLPFVDYSTLQARQHFCEEEVRLNRALAPSLYLGVTRITGTEAAPELDGVGPVLEYAVCMRRFPDGALFSEQLEAGTLSAADVDGLAVLLADCHRQAPRAGVASGFAGAAQRRAAAVAALEGVAPLASSTERAALQSWLEDQATALAPLWQARLARGRVRECHGDLHLANVVSMDGTVAAFDCIEFDPALRWLDVLDDAAFAVMDFAARGRRDLAYRFLNQWLDRAGDHDGLPGLHFAVVYRALVRAQVEQLRDPHGGTARRYLDTAVAWARPGQPCLFITFGLPGSGKTFASQQLLEREGAIRLRSDVERKRLYGLGLHDDSHAHGLNLYGADAHQRTYGHLLALAGALLRAGLTVVLDAAFLRRSERTAARDLAQSLGVPIAILACEAPESILRARLAARTGDASEADLAVMERLREVAEPLDGAELALACKYGAP